MRQFITIVFICMTVIAASAQTSSSDWQRGTVTVVSPHVLGPGEQPGATEQYDVSVKVGNTIYTCLFAPKGGTSVQYAPGIDFLVLVGDDTLTFNSKLSGTTQVPILRKQVLQAESEPDLSKAPGQYFHLKLQHLSDALNLSEAQQSRIRPILEQETAEVGQIWSNPVLSRNDKLDRYEKIVRASDKKVQAFLSHDQIEQLKTMRKEQKAELKRISADQKQKEAALK